MINVMIINIVVEKGKNQRFMVKRKSESWNLF